MTKRLSIILIALVSFCSFLSLPTFFQTTQVYADVSCDSLPDEAQEAAGCKDNEDLVRVVIINILYTIIGVSGIISVVYIVIGGLKFIYSRGSADMVQEGRRAVLYATIGLIVTSLAFIIVNFAVNTINNSQGEDSNSTSESISNTKKNTKDFYNPYLEFGAGAGGENVKIRMISQKSLKVGNEETIITHITPSWLADSEPIMWTSDAPNIASVDNSGKVTAKQEGVATITAKLNNNESASTKITVTKLIEPDSVTLQPSKVDKLASGNQYNLVATVYPRNATNKHITWFTDNAAVATVNSRGQVTGRKPGKANITAKTENGKTTTIPVTVVDTDGSVIKITPSLLSGLDYYYQTSHHEPISSACGSTAGSVSCGPAAYMAAVYALTKQKIDYVSFVNEACGRWLGSDGSAIRLLTSQFHSEYRSKYHVDIKQIPSTWDATVKELKKGHPVILFVHSVSDSVANAQGYRLTKGKHYVLALSYRNQGGGQVYIWSPVSEKAAPGRNIGDCSAGQCWYDKAAFQRNINEDAWTLWKI